MKKLILVAICFVSIQLSAQGNLQFNQVLTIEGTILNGTTLTPEFTPPTGKVWKIEYSNLKKNTNCGNQDLEINGVPVANNGNTTPIWINDQDTVRMKYTCGNTWWYFISVIEFNVIP